ncbi:MAG: ATP-dependent DNA helicase RecQ [Syntrophorhabdus sp. PtaB.Bin184]|nr:MAG: ATP-dependent DNA helicase RecQ [Syntrophorhabdus sp. PtaB.Bin184]
MPRVALTATADETTRREIIEKLRLAGARRFITSFDRPNIRYRVEIKEKEKDQLLEFIRSEHPGQSGIVYCMTRKKTEEIARFLQENGLPALPYHAGLDRDLRLRHQRDFLEGDGIIMVATIAFGMGINKPDIRFVAHLNLPRTLEGYYQETGRAGRDGEPADAWMVYSLADIVMLRQMLDTSPGGEDFKAIQYRKMEAMLGYSETARCRRQVLLGYFGETLEDPCGNCDTCLGNVEVMDGTVFAQKALSCAYRTGQIFGVNHLVDVLLGKDTARVRAFGHDRVSTFGIGRELSAYEWRSVYRQLVAAGLMRADMARKGGLRLSGRCHPVLRGEEVFELRKDPSPSARKTGKKSLKKEGAKTVNVDAESFAFDPDLWERLRSLRGELARASSLPAYTVFHDSTLREMATRLPQTLEEMLTISGVGQAKLEKYGKLFLEEMRKHKEETA